MCQLEILSKRDGVHAGHNTVRLEEVHGLYKEAQGVDEDVGKNVSSKSFVEMKGRRQTDESISGIDESSDLGE